MPSSTRSRVTGAQVIAYAAVYLGTPYVWGGKKPGGFDCSGLTEWVFSHFGLDIGPSTYQQINAGHAIDRSEVSAGDLVFFNYPGENPPGHVGIATSNTRMIHAPHTGATVTYASIDDNHYYGARRVLTDPAAITQHAQPTPTTNGSGVNAAGTQTGSLIQGGGFSVRADIWAREILNRVGVPHCRNNYVFMLAWMAKENGPAWNPLGCTNKKNGSTSTNSSGVQAYKTEEDGYQATADNLNSPTYLAIKMAMTRCADPHTTANAVTASPWGTGAFGDVVDSASAKYAEYASRRITGVGGQQSGTADTVVPGIISDPTGTVSNAITGALGGEVWAVAQRILYVVGGGALIGVAILILYREALSSGAASAVKTVASGAG